MKLREYPIAIYNSQQQLLQAELFARRLQQQVDRLTAKIDSSIAFDPELKNDAQRKARKIELLAAAEYANTAEAFQAAKDKLSELEAEHQFLLNRFSVAKLEKREAIAKLELQSASAA